MRDLQNIVQRQRHEDDNHHVYGHEGGITESFEASSQLCDGVRIERPMARVRGLQCVDNA